MPANLCAQPEGSGPKGVTDPAMRHLYIERNSANALPYIFQQQHAYACSMQGYNRARKYPKNAQFVPDLFSLTFL